MDFLGKKCISEKFQHFFFTIAINPAQFKVMGEALPQLILAIIYTYNNWEYVKEHDKWHPDQPFPTSILCMTFRYSKDIMNI